MSIWIFLVPIFPILIVWIAVFNLIRMVREDNDVSSDKYQNAKRGLIGLGIAATLALVYTLGPF